MFNFKEFYKKISSDAKFKKYLVIGVIGIILMIAASTILDTKQPDENPNNTAGVTNDGNNNNVKNGINVANAEQSLEEELEELLSRIENAGDVSVLITYENNGVIKTEKNTSQKDNSIQEKDANGGERTTTEQEIDSEVVYKESNNNKDPFVISQTYPEIRGVAVVAQGADDQVVVGKITKTLEVLLDLPVHKIQVTK